MLIRQRLRVAFPRRETESLAVIGAAGWVFLLLQVFFIDLMLGADNAVVIALACRRLPQSEARRAITLGAAGAIILRLGMVLFADALLGVPLVKLLAAWMLLVIALNIKAHAADGDLGSSRTKGAASDFVSAAAAIMLADAAMSLDNVVALAAIAGGNILLLATGVLLSIPILVYGAFILSHVIRRSPELLTIGTAFLGWIAGGMAVSDPLVADWIGLNAPALAILAPPLSAAFVVIAGLDARPHEAPPSTPSPSRRLTWGWRPERSREIGLGEAVAPNDALPPAMTAPLHAHAAEQDRVPVFASEASTVSSGRGWSEERIVVAGFALLALLAGLIIFLASFFDSLT